MIKHVFNTYCSVSLLEFLFTIFSTTSSILAYYYCPCFMVFCSSSFILSTCYILFLLFIFNIMLLFCSCFLPQFFLYIFPKMSCTFTSFRIIYADVLQSNPSIHLMYFYFFYFLDFSRHLRFI